MLLKRVGDDDVNGGGDARISPLGLEKQGCLNVCVPALHIPSGTVLHYSYCTVPVSLKTTGNR